MGTVADVFLIPGTKMRTSASAPNCIFLDRPPLILFKPEKPHPLLNSFIFTGLEKFPPGLVPICSVTCSFSATLYAAELKTFRINRTQLPIDLGYAFTDYKCQGKPFSHAIVDSAQPPGCRNPNSPYVALSRLKSLDGLLILRDFTHSSLLKPMSTALTNELQRLSDLDLS
jgi:hypothetical protein